MSTGSDWYAEQYLTSAWWKKIKKKVLSNTKYVCSISGCGKKKNLHFHHLSYDRRGWSGEEEDIVILCKTHHYLCHYSLFGKIPLVPRQLKKRYTKLNKATWRRTKSSTIIRWMVITYNPK